MTTQHAAYWTTADNGYEKTASAEMITTILRGLMEKHRFVVLMHKGYQSGNLVLVAVDTGGVAIDKPVDWPGTSKRVRVLFRDESNVWNYFTATVVQETKDTVKTEFPTELFRLQRRAYFRVSVPAGTTASFRRGERRYEGLVVSNLSVGGMLVCTPAAGVPKGLKEQVTIEEIELLIPDEEAEDGVLVLPVRKGVIVRAFADDNKEAVCFGVQFAPAAREEEQLLQYVRTSELDALRKGVAV